MWRAIITEISHLKRSQYLTISTIVLTGLYVLQVSYEGYFSLASKVVRVWDAVQQKIDDK